MLHPKFNFNTEVFCQSTHGTHWVSHSPLSQEALGQFHRSSYKIMDRHHTPLGASTAHHGPHKDFIYSCWITPLSRLFTPSPRFSATAHTIIVDDRTVQPRPLCCSLLFGFVQEWSDCVASIPLSPWSEPNHPEHHILLLTPIIHLLNAGVWSSSLTLIS